MSTTPTVVLVHGAAHANPHFMDFLVQWLVYYNIPVVRTSCPSDGCDPPTKGLYDDAKYVREILTREIDAGKDVVVFMHSYGGVVGTEASQGLGKVQREKDGLKGGIVHLFYCTAWLLPKDECLGIATNERPELARSVVTFQPSGKGLFHSPEQDLYGDLLSQAASYWATQIGAYTLQACLEPLTYNTWKDIPVTYLHCTKDEAIVFELQQYYVERLRASGVVVKTETLEAAHSPFLNMPAKVAESVARACGIVI